MAWENPKLDPTKPFSGQLQTAGDWTVLDISNMIRSMLEDHNITEDFNVTGNALMSEATIQQQRAKRWLYLTGLANRGMKTVAAMNAGITNYTLMMWRRKCPIFTECEKIASSLFQERLQLEMYRRGVEGVTEPVIGGKNRDEIVCTVRKYSDKCLEMLGRIHMKEMQNGHQINIQNNNNGETETKVVTNNSDSFDFERLDPDQLNLVRQLALTQKKKNESVLEGEAKEIDG